MGDREELIKAWKIMEDENSTEREKFLAEQREKYIMDKHAIHAAGYDKGLQQGLQQGIQQSIEMIAKKMKEKNIEISVIMELTGLTKETIEKL